MAAKELGTPYPKDLPCEIPETGSEAAFHRVNEVDSLMCPKCSKTMKIISFIEEEPVESLSFDLEALDRKVEREVIC
jgi:hypothetical protein